MTSFTLGEVVARLGGVLNGDPSLIVERVATLEAAVSGSATFLANPRYAPRLGATQASVVILGPGHAKACPVASIETPQPYLYFARLSALLNPPIHPSPGVSPASSCNSEVPTDAYIGPNAFIGANVVLGQRIVIGAGCSVMDGVQIGDDTILNPGVTVYYNCIIGRRAIVHSGAVIGADGFGFARETDGSWVKIQQVGRVVIGDDVEIGANTTVDRGAIGDTVIGSGVKLDNQIQVAHNVSIGDHTAIAGCVGIAGSAKIGSRCTVGGGAIILGHIELADEVHVSSGTLVGKSILVPGTYTGTVPFLPHRDWLQNFSRLRHLDALADKIRGLENRVAELEGKL